MYGAALVSAYLARLSKTLIRSLDISYLCRLLLGVIVAQRLKLLTTLCRCRVLTCCAFLVYRRARLTLYCLILRSTFLKEYREHRVLLWLGRRLMLQRALVRWLLYGIAL